MADMEKNHLEQVETNVTDDSEKHPLEQQQTLQQVDLDNHQAFKGDDSDGKVDWTPRKLLAAAFLAMLYTGALGRALHEESHADVLQGSQVPLYFAGATLSFIAKDIDAAGLIGWLPVANTLTIASVCPFVGYLQDLFGKRYIAIFGALLLCVGCLGQALVGMGMSGAGAGIGELTGLAGIYNGVTAIGLLVFYHPHAHVRAEGLAWQAVVKRIDFLGGFLSISGLVLFLVALQAGGYTHPWTSAYVLCCLLIGLVLICAWILWEAKFARHPMVPPELFMHQRVVALSFAVAFVAGMNFFSLLNFWPLAISTVWDAVPVKIGLRGLPVGLATACGAIFWNALLSTWKGGARWILVISACMLTGFGGSLAIMSPDNVVATVAIGICAAFGLGGVLVPAATVAMIAAPDALITTCAALSLSVRAVGGAIGYSIYYNIFSGKIKKLLPALVAEYAIKAGLPLTSAELFVTTYLTAPTEIAGVPGVNAQVLAGALEGTQWAYAESLHYVWYTSIAFGICSIVAAASLPNTRRFETNRIAVAL
ncbi:hypothetical protein LTR53_007471 [Teratosphaeriaceae sp. CCFEE 6253]|nr:hypothetical protein LTR53_007471 [Teratosphaeriaceae sp. CCFEE 6253]